MSIKDIITSLSAILDTVNSLPSLESAPDVISFTIKYGPDIDVAIYNCHAENGMSIGEWIYSNYVINQLRGVFHVEGHTQRVISSVSGLYLMHNDDNTFSDDKVLAYDLIHANEIYTVIWTSDTGPV